MKRNITVVVYETLNPEAPVAGTNLLEGLPDANETFSVVGFRRFIAMRSSDEREVVIIIGPWEEDSSDDDLINPLNRTVRQEDDDFCTDLVHLFVNNKRLDFYQKPELSALSYGGGGHIYVKKIARQGQNYYRVVIKNGNGIQPFNPIVLYKDVLAEINNSLLLKGGVNSTLSGNTNNPPQKIHLLVGFLFFIVLALRLFARCTYLQTIWWLQ